MIAFLDDISVLEELRAAPREVACMFDHPLEALLDPELLRDSEKLVPLGSEHWPYETELHVSCSSHISFFLRLINAVYVLLDDSENRTSLTSLGWALCIACIASRAPPRL